MSTQQTAATLLIVGSVVFLVGAAIGVPRVFTEPDPEARLRMVRERITTWRAAQPLYGLGPLIASVGVGYLAAGASSTGARVGYVAACLALVLGVLAWGWTLYQRSRWIAEFAFRRLPGWSFATYVLLTVGGLALLGAGLLVDGLPTWLGWLTLGADAVFLTAYLRFKDIPPFVFYLLTLLIGIVLV